jgi:polyisoprenoid-binding protein YceI
MLIISLNQQQSSLNKKISFSLLMVLLTVLLSSCVYYDSNKRTFTIAESVVFAKSDDINVESYFLSPVDSKITVKVYRAGRLASLGHNHVITVGGFNGVLYLHNNLAQSQVKINIPVSQFIVDDQSARITAGEEFQGKISAKDVQATRNNLLGEQLLMADQYPMIKLNVEKITGTLPLLTLATVITVRNYQSKHLISSHVVFSKKEIEISGRFSIKQTDLGLSPFSLFGGAIAVADNMDVEFTLVAKAVD